MPRSYVYVRHSKECENKLYVRHDNYVCESKLMSMRDMIMYVCESKRPSMEDMIMCVKVNLLAVGVAGSHHLEVLMKLNGPSIHGSVTHHFLDGSNRLCGVSLVKEQHCVDGARVFQIRVLCMPFRFLLFCDLKHFGGVPSCYFFSLFHFFHYVRSRRPSVYLNRENTIFMNTVAFISLACS